jgi:hypothetical protein
MFWSKRFKRNLPEEMKNSEFILEAKTEETDIKYFNHISEETFRLKNYTSNPLVEFIIYKIKTDEKFFDEFVNFLDRNQNRHDLLMSILRANLIEDSRKIFPKKDDPSSPFN